MGLGASKQTSEPSRKTSFESIQNKAIQEISKDYKKYDTKENKEKRAKQNELNEKIKKLRREIINYEIKLDRYNKNIKSSKNSEDTHDAQILQSILLEEQLNEMPNILNELQEKLSKVETDAQYKEIENLFEEDIVNNFGYLFEDSSSASGLKLNKKNKKNETKKNINKLKGIIKKIKTKMKKIKINKTRKNN